MPRLLVLPALLALAILAVAACTEDDSGDGVIVGTATPPPAQDNAPTQPAALATVAPTRAPAVTPTATQPPRPKLGETVEKSGSRYTVNAVEDPWTSTNQFIRPKSGTRFVAVDVTQEATAPTDEANPLYFYLVDAKDFEYRATAAGREPSFNSGNIAQGQKRRGWVVFEVATDVKPAAVLAQAEPLGGRTLIADLR